VAAAFTIVRLSRFNELSAILAAGVPLVRVALPIVLASLMLNVLLLVDQETLIPRLIPKLTREHDDVGQASVKSFRIDAMQDADGSLLFAARYTPPTENSPAVMREMDLILRDPEHRVTGHIRASRAVYEPQHRRWALADGVKVSGLAPDQRRSRETPADYYASDVTPDEIALYRSGETVELLSTARINELLARPQNYGTIDLLRTKHARVTQWVMNLVVVLLAIGCVLTREPGKLKTDGLKLLIMVGLAMAAVFLCHHLAGLVPVAGAAWADRWPAIMAWLPIFVFAPIAVWLLDRMHSMRS
jgi:lipopolysaccharide export system permease protein